MPTFPDENLERLLDAVEARQVELKMGPTEFADRADLAFSTLNGFLNRTRKPYRKTLRGVARALGWPVDAPERILSGEDPEEVLEFISGSYSKGTTMAEPEGGFDVDVVFREGADVDDRIAEQAVARTRRDVLVLAADLEDQLESEVMRRGWQLATRQQLGVDRHVDVAWFDDAERPWIAEIRLGLVEHVALADQLVGFAADLRAQLDGLQVVIVSRAPWPAHILDRLNRHHIAFATPEDWSALDGS